MRVQRFCDFFFPPKPKSISLAGAWPSFLSACLTQPLCTDWYAWRGQKRKGPKRKKKTGGNLWEYHKTTRSADSCCHHTKLKTRPPPWRKRWEGWKFRSLQ